MPLRGSTLQTHHKFYFDLYSHRIYRLAMNIIFGIEKILLQYFSCINDRFYYQTGSYSIKLTDGNYNTIISPL